jgi:hypothetical protein
MNDRNFDKVLKRTKKTEWEAFTLVVDKFLRRHEAPNCRELVEEMSETYRMMGCNMTRICTSFIITWIYSNQTL